MDLYETGLLNRKKWLNGQLPIGENFTSQLGKYPGKIRIPYQRNLKKSLPFSPQSQIHASLITLYIYVYL